MLRRWRELTYCCLVAGLLIIGITGAACTAEAGALSAESVWTAAENVLMERLATEDKTVTYRWTRFTTLPESITVPDDADIALIASLPRGIHYGSPTPVRVLVKDGETRLYDWLLTFQVKKYVQAVTAAYDLPAGATLGADNLRLDVCDVTRLHGEYYRTVEEAVGLETVRPLTVGTLVSAMTVRQPLLVKQGDVVQLIGRSGTVVVETTAEALTGGRINQLVRVKNKVSGKVITARVKARGVVEVLR